MQTTVFNVSEIKNTNSATTIKNAVTSLTGVSNVSVDTTSSKVTVTYDPSSTDVSAIKNAITTTGFSIQ